MAQAVTYLQKEINIAFHPSVNARVYCYIQYKFCVHKQSLY